MKKLLVIIIFSLATIVLSGCSLFESNERILSNEEWIEDIKYLDSNLRTEHPDIFKYVSEEEWNKSIENLKSEINQLSDRSIVFRIGQIVGSIEDAHTIINYFDLLTPVGEEQIKAEDIVEFPIKCEYFDDGVRITESDSKYKEMLGAKLVAINDIGIDKIISDISTLSSHDYNNEQCALFYAKEIMNYYEVLKFFEIVDKNKATYTFEDDNKQRINMKIKAIENKNINYIMADKKTMKTNKVPNGENEIYWYKNFKEDNILYFRLNKFTYKAAVFKTREEEMKFPDIYEVKEGLLNEINKNEYNKFVIDVRENMGGHVDTRNSIVDMLKFSANLKDAQMYILTSKESNSAATTFTWELQKKLGAKVVGETTGGNVNLFTSGGQTIDLPNSKLTINVSAYESIKEKGYIGGVKPDYEVMQNYEDYINGIDTCYEFIRNNK